MFKLHTAARWNMLALPVILSGALWLALPAAAAAMDTLAVVQTAITGAGF